MNKEISCWGKLVRELERSGELRCDEGNRKRQCLGEARELVKIVSSEVESWSHIVVSCDRAVLVF